MRSPQEEKKDAVDCIGESIKARWRAWLPFGVGMGEAKKSPFEKR